MRLIAAIADPPGRRTRPCGTGIPTVVSPQRGRRGLPGSVHRPVADRGLNYARRLSGSGIPMRGSRLMRGAIVRVFVVVIAAFAVASVVAASAGFRPVVDSHWGCIDAPPAARAPGGRPWP